MSGIEASPLGTAGLPLSMHACRSALTILRFFRSHPLTAARLGPALGRWLRWQVGARVAPGPVVVPFVKPAVLVMRPGMVGATGNYYAGMHEFADMGFLLHFLRAGDLFVDVGANVGSYTTLASAVVGAETIAVEPIAEAFEALELNVRVNGVLALVRPVRAALAARPGTLTLTANQDTTNHVVEARDSPERLDAAVIVEATTLDDLLGDRHAALVKIDVEGFEKEVLSGATRALKESRISALIVELNGSGERYGVTDEQLHDQVLAHGFSAWDYDPRGRGLVPKSTHNSTGNTLYLRGPEAVRERLRSAQPFEVLGERF